MSESGESRWGIELRFMDSLNNQEAEMVESHNKQNKRNIAKTISLLIDDRNEIPE